MCACVRKRRVDEPRVTFAKQRREGWSITVTKKTRA